jgi:hypothetical protein
MPQNADDIIAAAEAARGESQNVPPEDDGHESDCTVDIDVALTAVENTPASGLALIMGGVLRPLPASSAASSTAVPEASVAASEEEAEHLEENQEQMEETIIMKHNDKILVKTVMKAVTNQNTEGGLSPNDVMKITKDKVRGKTWILMKVSNTKTIDEVGDYLATLEDLGCVGDFGSGSRYVLVRKNKYSMTAPNFLEVEEYLSLNIPCGAIAGRTFLFRFIQTLQTAFNRFVSNFAIKSADPLVDESGLALVIEAFKSMTIEECEEEILRAKLVPANKRTKYDTTVIKGHMQLMSLRKLAVVSGGAAEFMKRNADNPSIIPFKHMTRLHSVIAWTVDVESGELIEFTVENWVRDAKFLTHALILHGEPRLGKTRAAESLAAFVSTGLWEDAQSEPYYIYTTTVDNLRRVTDLMKPGVAIILDDVDPSSHRGTRPAMNLNECKHLLNVCRAEGVDARNADILINARQPRIVTSNIATPGDWIRGLPDARAMTTVQRKAMGSDYLAIYKRVCFAHVSSSLIEEERKRAFADSDAQHVRQKIARMMN